MTHKGTWSDSIAVGSDSEGKLLPSVKVPVFPLLREADRSTLDSKPEPLQLSINLTV